jgi:hypothetical protein
LPSLRGVVLGEAGMNKIKKTLRRRRKRRSSRPYLIDIEDFETVEDIEMEDWMFGSSGGHLI